MKIYRISSSKHINDLTGIGGLFASGRWHKKGTRLVYFSETVALAKIEKLANSPTGVPQGQKLLILRLPKDLHIQKLKTSNLDRKWNYNPPSLNNYKLISDWLDEGRSLLLKVPSIHSPFESNYLMNPSHSDLSSISKEVLELEFDNRLK